MKNTSKIGNTTVAKLLGALAASDKVVLMPFGEGLRYDLVLDEAGTFIRVQCKTGKLKGGCVTFKNYSVTGSGSRRYGSSVDAYGVYCPQNGKCYYVPAADCAGFETSLRVEPAKNGMRKNIRHAGKYEL
jgi:hypothetical protein